MSQSISTTIKGVSLPETVLVTALDSVPTNFSKRDFAQALGDAGLSEASDSDLVRRAMQFLKRQGLISHTDDTGTWSLTPLAAMRLPSRTLPLTPELVSPAATLADQTEAIHPAAEKARLGLGFLSCLMLIAALIGLNASFAWELGQETFQTRFLMTMGLMALDMIRPGLVVMGIYNLKRAGLRFAGALAIVIALGLSPMSILSTTSIVSASFLMGAEINTDADTRADTRKALQSQHANLLQRAAQDEAAWRRECARGGCGPIARELEAEFQRTLTEAQEVLDRIVELTEADQGTSALLARLVTTFEGLGLFGAGREILLPLFLAISLELGALFGPALLLRRRL